MARRIDAGSMCEFREQGYLVVGSRHDPICVFPDSSGEPRAIDGKCPHLGSLLQLGTVENGIVECHWHGARFEVKTGRCLDPFSDDVNAYLVEVEGDRIVVLLGP